MSDTATLVAQWTHDGKQFRLVAVGRYTRGYEDEYVLERQDTDALGGSMWVFVDRWRPGGISGAGDIRSILASGARAAISTVTK